MEAMKRLYAVTAISAFLLLFFIDGVMVEISNAATSDVCGIPSEDLNKCKDALASDPNPKSLTLTPDCCKLLRDANSVKCRLKQRYSSFLLFQRIDRKLLQNLTGKCSIRFPGCDELILLGGGEAIDFPTIFLEVLLSIHMELLASAGRDVESNLVKSAFKSSYPDVSQGSERNNTESETKRVFDATKLGAEERRLFIDHLIKNIENDNLQLLLKLRERLDRVDVKLPTVEVRYKNLHVEAECGLIEGTPLPTLWNSTLSFFSGLSCMMSCKTQEAKISILKDVSGIIKPSRLTLLLGPPRSGKTTLLQALAGKATQTLKVSGEISYNGFLLDEFVPERTSSYVSQYDLHIPEITVRETIDFSASCQGAGSRVDILAEVTKREKEAGISPDPDIDTYMKAISVDGTRSNLQTDYVLKILGLEICADVSVGHALQSGISGGQMKRLTTGEMIVGPNKCLFMDEISTGLDSSTTFQIVTCLQQLVHITDATALISLLQPAPETFELFDDLIMMAASKVVYHGPRNEVLAFFEDCGFKCPERKGVADFLQEVISEKDQRQYWSRTDLPYSYVSVDQFSQNFKRSYWGQKLHDELSRSYDKSQSQTNALSFSKYSLSKWRLFRACMDRELLLMKRNAFIYIFKTAQLFIIGCITMTVFIDTQKEVNSLRANFLMGSLYYTLVRLNTNGIAELTLTISRLPVVYKQKDFYLYPAWAYTIPASLLKIPFSITDALLWTAVTYYVIGYSPETERFFCQFLLLFALHLSSAAFFRFVASVFQTVVTAITVSTLLILIFTLFGGFILPKSSLPSWLSWGFWLSPLSYGEIAITLNEFHAPRWQKVQEGNITMGTAILRRHGLDFSEHFYWISVAVLFGLAALFDLGFTLGLTYIPLSKISPAILSKKRFSQLQGDNCKQVGLENQSSIIEINHSTTEMSNTGKMVLPFEPLTIVFKDVQYFVDTPLETKGSDFKEKKLQLLQDVTGTFRPGVLTALMGVSGAGKTTLIDVLSGRKTTGIIKGDIRIGGYPKVQKTFARISGYCEQNDIHSPYITVGESIEFSAWLRLPPEIDPVKKMKFVEEVVETIELNDIKDSLVGIAGKSGLSTEQRKRLTIAGELVSNPSIIFMDEPTSGLDSRAAAVVMRAVRKVVSTGRTTVCTIHQPSIDVFETFDELVLMKKGGRIIYSGMLGRHSRKLIEYFESIPGVPKIKDNYNPATWMMEVTSSSVEADIGIDFADIYKASPIYSDTLKLVRELSQPKPGSQDLQFLTRFPQKEWVQFTACLWKQVLSYWRNPEYNLSRIAFMIVLALIFGIVFWQKGSQINDEQDLVNVLGSTYVAVLFLGVTYCSSIQPYITTERTVFYREQYAGMYSAKAYAFAQIAIEVPYILLHTVIYVIITYSAIGYEWSPCKFFWFFYATFFSLLYFVYLGMMIASLSPNLDIATILATATYTILNLFSGFLMPGPKIPKWWIWCYWVFPASWSLNVFLTSQYGDMNKEILISGERQTVSAFLRDYYGFNHDHLKIVAVGLIAFSIAYASIFAFCIGKLNFQKR